MDRTSRSWSLRIRDGDHAHTLCCRVGLSALKVVVFTVDFRDVFFFKT